MNHHQRRELQIYQCWLQIHRCSTLQRCLENQKHRWPSAIHRNNLPYCIANIQKVNIDPPPIQSNPLHLRRQ